METTSPLAACELHHTHVPTPMTVDAHHVIPVAWQLLWRPQVAPYPGKDPAGRGVLWDARTVNICPTGHRNTHVWIVRLMRALKSEDPSQAFLDAKAAKGLTQATTALLALQRFAQYGGTLQQLIAAGQWGMS